MACPEIRAANTFFGDPVRVNSPGKKEKAISQILIIPGKSGNLKNIPDELLHRISRMEGIPMITREPNASLFPEVPTHRFENKELAATASGKFKDFTFVPKLFYTKVKMAPNRSKSQI